MSRAGLALGAGLGLASAEVVRRVLGERHLAGDGAALLVAAVIYPAARREHGPSVTSAVEAAVVVAAAGVSVLATRRSARTGPTLLAAAWAAHAAFDYLQGPSPDSRLPGWYPSWCAGFDLAYAARLLR